MPRQQTLQIEGRPIVDITGPSVGTQVVARPVDTFEDTGMAQKMTRLNHMLEAGTDLMKTIDEVDTKQGAQDAALGKEMKKTVLGSYEKGWLGVRGAIAGAEDMEKVKASYENGFDRNAPGGLEKFLQDRHQELTKGMQRGPYADAYAARLATGFNELRLKHFDEQRDAVVAQHENDVVRLLVGGVKGKTEISPEDFNTVRNTLKEQGMGMDPKRFDQLGKNALSILAGDGNVQAIRAARKAQADGTNAFPTIPEEDMERLEDHAVTVRLQKQEAADKLIKTDHEHQVADTMFPIIQLAQAGNTMDAQKAFDKVVSSNLFAHEPQAIEKWQRLLVSTGDKSDSFEQVALLNKVSLGILSDGWGLREIQSSGLTPKLMRDAFLMFDHKRREERQAASEAKAQERAAQALDKSTRITGGADFRPTVKATLEMLPEMGKEAKDMDFSGKHAQAVQAIRVDAEQELIRTAVARGSDIDAWRQDVVRIRENAIKRTEVAIKAPLSEMPNLPPANIRHDSWADYVAAAKRGEYGDNVAELDAARKWFKAKADREARR